MTEGLDRHGQTKVVLDPVMVATSGDRLLKPDAVEMLVQLLIPRALVITPNLPEAAALLGRPIAESEDAMRGQAERLILLGARNVLIKGGHGSGAESVDLLVGRDTVTRLAAPRIETQSTHGTGCTLSSAIAAGLAKGLPLLEAAREAKDFVTGAIAAANRLIVGSGHGPVHHFHRWWERERNRTRNKASKEQEDDEHHPKSGRRWAEQRVFWRRHRSRARKHGAGAWSRRGRAACPVPACRPSVSPNASMRCPADVYR